MSLNLASHYFRTPLEVHRFFPYTKITKISYRNLLMEQSLYCLNSAAVNSDNPLQFFVPFETIFCCATNLVLIYRLRNKNCQFVHNINRFGTYCWGQFFQVAQAIRKETRTIHHTKSNLRLREHIFQ